MLRVFAQAPSQQRYFAEKVHGIITGETRNEYILRGFVQRMPASSVAKTMGNAADVSSSGKQRGSSSGQGMAYTALCQQLIVVVARILDGTKERNKVPDGAR